MKDYMEYDTLEERLMHMVYGLTISPEHSIALGAELTKTVNEILDELSERERVILLNHLKGGESVEEQAAKYEVEEDEIQSVIGTALRKISHPKCSKRLAAFINLPEEARIKKIIKRNPKLMDEFSIGSPKEFVKALGDRYDCDARNAIMSRLSAKERAWVKEYYLRNCKAGMDRFPACIKVMINFVHGDAWTPRDNAEVKAEFDRIKSMVKYSCKADCGMTIKLQSPIDAEFEDAFFSVAEAAQWRTALEEEGTFAMDSNPVSIECEFAEGFTCDMKGNIPSYYPYDKLFDMSQKLFRKLREQVLYF